MTMSDTRSASEFWRSRLLLLAVLVLQSLYFLSHARDASLHRDEASDYFIAISSWPELVHQFATDWDPYVFLLAQRFWLALVGHSPQHVRSLSWLSLMLATVVMFRVARRWFGNERDAGAAAVFFGCAHPMLTVAVGYARPYTMALLTGLWCFDRLQLYLDRPDRRRAAWLFVAALCFGNIQPVNYALAAAISLWLGWRIVRRSIADWRALWWREGLLPVLVLAVAAAPSLVQALRFAASETGMAAVPAEALSISYLSRVMYGGLLTIFSLLPQVLQYAADDNISGWLRALPAGRGWWCLVVVLPVLAWACAAWWRALGALRARSQLLECLILSAVPLLLLGLGSFVIDRLAIPFRSYSATALGLCLLLTGLLRAFPAVLSLAVVLVLLRAAAVWTFFNLGSPGRWSDARDAAAFMTGQEQPTDLVVLANPALGPSFHYAHGGTPAEVALPYEHPVRYWNDIQLWRDLTTPGFEKPALQRVADALAAGRRVWFVWGGGSLDAPPEAWHPYFAPAAYRAARTLLDERARMVTNAWFERTGDPYRVELHEPREKSP